MKGLTEGRIVHYVLNEGHNSGQHRPAMVVRVWRDGEGYPPENGVCQLQVFTDSDKAGMFNDELPQVMWKTSVIFSDTKEPGSWHWIEGA